MTVVPRILVRLCLVMTAVLGPALGATRDCLSITEAKSILKRAMVGHLRGADVVPLATQDMPAFYGFEALNGSAVASPHIGTFAVNKYTGQVWNLEGHCQYVTTPELERVQQQIRIHHRITAKLYNMARELKPSCDADFD